MLAFLAPEFRMKTLSTRLFAAAALFSSGMDTGSVT